MKVSTQERKMEPVILTAEQTAKTLSISPRTLWSMTKQRAIQSIRIGRRVLYAVADIQKFIDEHRVKGAIV
jgi:excisionase family DNA binding protein